MVLQEQLQDLTESYLKSLIAEVSGSLRLEFDSFAPFGELGIDSFHVLKIIRKLEVDFGTLPKTLLFEYFNVSDLASYFVDKHAHSLSLRFFEDLQAAGSPGSTAVRQLEPSGAITEVKQGGANGTTQPIVAALVCVPVRILETGAYKDPELATLVQSLFERYKSDGCVSRGTRTIAPNLFIGTARRGYFNYGKSRNIILVYGYTGPRDYLSTLAEEMYHYCSSSNFQLNIIADEEVQPINGVRFSATPFGAMQRLFNLKAFTLEGGSMRRLRYQVSKFQKTGACRTEDYRCGSNKKTDKDIACIVDRWCDARTMVNPMVYEVKREILAGALRPGHRLFLTYLDNVLQNVILITATSADAKGYLMDLEFYPPGMPLGGLEFAIVQIIEVLASEGCDLLSLGGTYGCKLSSCANADPEIDRILDDLRQQNIFNDQGNLQFKNKFRPANKSIFLCRPVGSSNPDNVIDIIMMIADPEKMQTAEEGINNSSRTRRDGAAFVDQSLMHGLSSSRVAGTTGEGPTTGGDDRSSVLSEYGFNPINIPDELIAIDLKTDSWAQLRLPAIAEQMSKLQAQLQQPINVDLSLEGVFPFKHFVLTASGQAAEHLFFKSWTKKGIVLENLLFPSTIFHQIDNDFVPQEMPHCSVFDLTSQEQYKGNLDLEALRVQVAKDPSAIALVLIEVGNNAAGGYAVSMQHLRKVKEILARHAIPLVLDGTRAMENARFLIEQDKEHAGKSIWVVARELFSYADAVIGSLTKDFRVDKGGIIATNDVEMFSRLQKMVDSEGTGIDLIDQRIIALSLQKRKQIDAGVSGRMENVGLIWRALKDHDVPLVGPVGGHCILIDVKQIAEFKAFKYPVASFLAWMYLNTGIRAGAHSVGMQKHTSINQLVRLAIPIGLGREEIDCVIDQLIRAFDKKVNIPEIVVEGSASQGLGTAGADYTLVKYHNPSGQVTARTDSTTPISGNTLPTATGRMPSPVRASSKLAPNDPSSNATGGARAKLSKTEPSRECVNGKPHRTKDIAIVGMAGRYPKSKSLRKLWDNLAQGRDCIEDIPADRYDRRLQHGSAEKYRGGFIEDVDKFDSLFFNISPREAEMLDPQERLFLEVAWEAIEDAGYYPENLAQEGASRNVGVFVGAVWSMYQMLGVEEKSAGNQIAPNSFLWSIANRVSYWMNLSGPSLTVDTACSSSLMAVHLACEAMHGGECSSAIVGGVNLDLHQAKMKINRLGGALSVDGVCRSFGKGANGYVAGEGIGALFLKPLDQAVEDGDNIHGVIKSVVVNHGGRTGGYTVPNPNAQTNVIVSALKKAAIDARSIGYIEAHGTGTQLGDPIEITGLSNAFKAYAVEKQSCAVGSIKSNIGHLEAAAGIVSISKVLLQMKHHQIVPSLHSSELNEFIDFPNSPFYVAQTLEEWKGKEVDDVLFPIRAGISSFGAGGSNAHIILENYEPVMQALVGPNQQQEWVFPLSAKNDAQLHEAAVRLAEFLPQNNDDLADIAYTLQIRRKSFDHRVAVIAKTKEELLERLTCYIAGQKAKYINTGEVKEAEGITRLLDRREREEFIRVLLQRKDPQKIADLWAKGLLPDWRGLQVNGSGKTVSLPTYVFADKRHWASNKATAKHSATSAAGIHPLVDSNESTFERQVFKKTFHERDFFIYDHLVANVPTLPGVAYLELARKAGEIAGGRPVRRIRNILWLSPIAVLDSTPKEVFIELKSSGETVGFDVFSIGTQGNRLLHSQGKLLYETREEAARIPEYIDLDGIRARCSKAMDGSAVYSLFRSVGLNLGHSFQVLQEVYKSDSEVFGVMKLPEFRHGDLLSMVLHPSLVDGSLQAGMAAQLGGAAGEMLVPYSIREVEILAPLQANCFSYVTEVKDEKKDGKKSRVLKSNVLIADQAGKVLVKISESVGVPLQEVHKKSEPRPDVAEFSTLYYAYEWEKASLGLKDAKRNSLGSMLLFDKDNKLRDLYQEQLREAGATSSRIILVRPGASFQELEEQSFSINPGSKDDFSHLFELLVARDCLIENICFAWQFAPIDFYDGNRLRESLEGGVFSLLSVCQALIEQKLESKVQLLYLYSAKHGGAQPHNDAVSGFVNTLRMEHPKLLCKTLEMVQGDNAHAKTLDGVLAEFRARTQDATVVRYELEERSIRKLKAFNLEEAGVTSSSKGIELREHGVYLITGGAGGLGLLLAEMLVKKFKARLILTGRSELSAEQEAKLDELREFGAEVVYFAADVSHYEDVKILVNETKSRFGWINGIIHAAGVVRDSYIRNKRPEEMIAVIAPKVYGTLHLDEVTRNEPLDFFVTFSSLAAVTGNAGQCDYSFANYFMDSFAAVRELHRASGTRAGKTLSVNWSLWQDGRMRPDEQTELYFKKVLGMRPLSKETGLEVLVRGLASGRSQFAVLEGVQEKLELAWGVRRTSSPPAETAPPAFANQAAATVPQERDGVLLAQVQKDLSQIVMELLKLDAEDMSVDKILMDLGFDSIGLATFANAVNEKYGLDITPVLFFDYPSVIEIAKYLSVERESAIREFYRGSATAMPVFASPSASIDVAVRVGGQQDSASENKTSWGDRDGGNRQAKLHPSAEGSWPDVRFANDPIAIVGMGGVMPQSPDLEIFWENLKNSRDLITVIPEDRWSWEQYYGDPLKEANKSNSKWGGFMNEIDKFDPLFFGISPREAQTMDPQQRIFLEVVWQAIEDSGQKVSDLSGTRTGVFVGVATSDYLEVMNNQHAAVDAYSASGNSHSVLANRISFLLNLRGPSAPIDTACSSSLIALHRAIESIHTGSCDMAIVGGVQVMLSPFAYISFAMAGMLSGDGKCKTFDKRANGYSRGEGCGAVLLKRLSAAEADGNHIYAVIKATAENHGGRVTTLTAPNSSSQSALLIEAYEKARVDPTTVGYIECHGTGTSLGDPIELQALSKAFSVLYKKCDKAPAQTPHCGLSSVKTNIGHLETAAGIASLLKALLAIKHKQIPASLHFEEINPYIKLTGTPFYIADKLTQWKAPRGEDGSTIPRRAGVSSFGFGGANVHVVLEEYIHAKRDFPALAPDLQVILLSAKNEDRLKAYIESMRAYLGRHTVELVDFAYTLQVGRDEMPERLALVVSSMGDLKQKFSEILNGGERPKDCYRNNIRNRDAKSQGVEGGNQKSSVQALIGTKELSKLAELWVSGAEIDWRFLHESDLPRRISIPTYPFARERYWIPGVEAKATEERQHVGASGLSYLHPLIHRNVSTLEEQKFSSRFSGEEFYLTDHVVESQIILPGVAYLEMARAAGELSGTGQVCTIRNVTWQRPLIVGSDGVEVEISLTPVKDEVVFSIKTVSKEQSVVHSTGKLAYSADTPPPEALEVNRIQGRCSERVMPGKDLYQLLRSSGLELGKSFQIVETMYANETESLTVLRLPEQLKGDANQFWLHPALMDGCLHTAIGLMKRDGTESQLSIPYSVGEVQIFHPLQDVSYGYATWASDSFADNQNHLKVNFHLLDKSGKVLVRIKDFVSRPLHRETTKAMPQEVADLPQGATSEEETEARLQSLLPVWNAVRLPTPERIVLSEAAQILLLGGNGVQLEWVRKCYANAQLLQLASASSVDGIAKKLGDYSFDQLLWIAPDAGRERDELTIDQQEEGVLSVFRIVKALLQLGYANKKLQWTVITSLTRQVVASDPVEPTHAGVIGLMGSLAKEYPRWDLRLLDLDSQASVTAQECLSLPWDKQGNGLAHRRDQWFQQGLALIATLPETRSLYRQNGVYIVIGGAGGVGQVWTRFMMEHYQADVVWIGRRKHDAAIADKINLLGRMGRAPLYLSADCTDLDALTRARDIVLQTHPVIHGVVHSAIVLQDQSIARMDESIFRAGLAAKIDVSVNMDRVFGKLELDFMLLFSSIISFSKSPGQANYSAGCTFKDSFAQKLQQERTYPVKIMNWGYWGNVGVVADKSYNKIMAQMGIGSIEPDEGMASLQVLVGSEMHQLALIKTLKSDTPAGPILSEAISYYPRKNLAVLPHVQRVLAGRVLGKPMAALSAELPTSEMNDLVTEILASSLKSLGLFINGNHTIAQLSLDKPPAPYYERWVSSSMRYLQQQKVLADDRTFNREVRRLPDLWAEWDAKRPVWGAKANLQAQIALLEVCLRALPGLVSGKLRATDVMFPNSSMHLVEGVYGGNALADHFNEVLGNVLSACIEQQLQGDKKGKIRILEIGAGTGGTTAKLLPILQPYAIEEYCYTDVSKAFLMHAEKHFKPGFPALTTAIFDISKPLALQSVAANHYDFVIAANVLHATFDIRETVRNAKAALKNQGVLLLNEISEWRLFNHLTFGLLEGWWLHEDSALRLPGSPGLAPEKWREILEEEGFESSLFPAEGAHKFGQQLVAAASNGRARQRIVGQLPLRQPTHVDSPPLHAKKIAEIGTRNGTSSAGELMSSNYVSGIISEKLSEALRMDAAMIRHDSPFADYGVDSIIGVDLVRAISEALQIELETTSLFEYSTVDQLTRYILKMWHPQIAGQLAQVQVNSPNFIQPKEKASVDLGIASKPRFIEKKPLVGQPKEFDAELRSETRTSGAEPIAIIGMSGRFAGSESLNAFWQNLTHGIDSVRKATRWSAPDCAVPGSSGSANGSYGGFLDSIDQFDPAFFGIAAEEATYIDPQQRLFLEETWSALEDAGYCGTSVRERQCGLYVGCGSSNYDRLFVGDSPPQAFWGNSASVVPARIAYHLNLQGPAIAVDTACSSSLVAIHLACQGLWLRETEMALAGGVFLQATPGFSQVANRAGMLSPQGKCYSFDARANGFVPGEGVGVVVLKRLRDALQDGDHVHGVIVGSGINQNGTSNGLIAPNARAQERLECSVYDRFKINPDTIQVIEAHGTGTIVGDSIEYEAISRAFRKYTDRKQFCAIGTVKTNIGHAATAAGIAGLLKLLLSLKNSQVPPSLHFEKANPAINFESGAFYVNTQLKEWEVTGNQVRRAAVSSFGFSGTNAHLVLDEPPSRERVVMESPGYAVVLSARTAEQLKRQVHNLLVMLGDTAGLSMNDVSFSLFVGRTHFSHRLSCMARNQEELIRLLQQWSETGAAKHVYTSEIQKGKTQEQPTLKRFGNYCIQECVNSTSPVRYLEYLATIAELYTQGYSLDFSLLFHQGSQRVPLPTYPFAKERYWVSNVDTAWSNINGRAEQNHAEKTAVSTALLTVDNEITWLSSPSQLSAAPGHSMQMVPMGTEQKLRLFLRQETAFQLNQPLDTISIEPSYFDLGLSSVDVMTILQKVNNLLDLNLPPSALFEYPNILSLAAYLAETYPVKSEAVTALRAAGAQVNPDSWRAEREDSGSHVMKEVCWREGPHDEKYEKVTF